MSERMTDDEVGRHIGTAIAASDPTVRTASAVALSKEIARAHTSEDQKDAVIKALADALREHGAHPRDCGTWLANGDFDEAQCSCGIAAALSLAGRL